MPSVPIIGLIAQILLAVNQILTNAPGMRATSGLLMRSSAATRWLARYSRNSG
jgi:hypothetical protein